MANIKIQSKIAMKSLGNPALVKDHTENQLLLGTIIGTATGVKIAKGQDGVTEMKGLMGTFEATPADATKDVIRSGVLWLGDAFQSQILDMLEDKDGPESVTFAFEIYVVKATNAAGYSWAMRPVLAAVEADPFAAIRVQMAATAAAAATPQIAGKK